MEDSIRLVDYFYIDAADRPGEAARILETLREARIDLLGFSGFPKGRRAQLDFMPADAAAFRALARRERWKLTGPKKGFLVQGRDRIGAVAEILGRLGAAGINVTASDAVCAGAGRFGMLLWVKPRDLRRAAKALGAR